MQRVWFEECIEGGSRLDLGLVSSPRESFRLSADETVATVIGENRTACSTARLLAKNHSLDTVVTGDRSGPRTVRWAYLQVRRELAHHFRHVGILREQILSR